MNALVPAAQVERAAPTVVIDPIPLLDSGRFEHMQRVAKVMACASLVPRHLRGSSFEEAFGNCFLVVNQAVRWQMDPFALAQATFITPDGKLGYEGKAVAAAIHKCLGFTLGYTFTGEPGTDGRGIVVSGVLPGEAEPRVADGTVGKWKTKGKDGAVKAVWRDQPDEQLIYRGTRQWCRRYASWVIMGVYTPDEFDDLEEDARARRARPVQATVSRPHQEPAAMPPPEGFINGAPVNPPPANPPHDRATSEITAERHPDGAEPDDALLNSAREAALDGSATYRRFYEELERGDRNRLVESGEHDRNKQAAAEADNLPWNADGAGEDA